MKTKEQTIEILETIARLLELKGENPFKIRAYTTAARALETFSGSFQSVVAENTLREIDGIGDAIAKKISEYVTTERLEYFEKLQAADVWEFAESFRAHPARVSRNQAMVRANPSRSGVLCRSGKNFWSFRTDKHFDLAPTYLWLS